MSLREEIRLKVDGPCATEEQLDEQLTQSPTFTCPCPSGCAFRTDVSGRPSSVLFWLHRLAGWLSGESERFRAIVRRRQWDYVYPSRRQHGGQRRVVCLQGHWKYQLDHYQDLFRRPDQRDEYHEPAI